MFLGYKIGRVVANCLQTMGSPGVGRALHEEPGFIPGYYDPKDKRVLKENQVITIEPFLSQVLEKFLILEMGPFFLPTLNATKSSSYVIS